MKQQRLLWTIRSVFVFLLLCVSINFTLAVSDPNKVPWAESFYSLVPYLAPLTILGVAGVVIFLDMRTRNKDITTLSAIYFGLLLGLLLGSLFTSAVETIAKNDANKWLWEPMRFLFTLVFCYICVSTLVQTKDDFRFIIPYVEFSKQLKGGKPLVLDTSVIIDGRIADICETKIIDTQMIVPRFVLLELQGIADSGDKLKRNRGRRGMDMLKRMQNNPKVELHIHEGNIPELREIYEVDQRLVILAKVLGARVVTNDYNLNKVAQLQGVEVINLNELANALKSVALPGETLIVRLIKPGDQVGQGIGYLDDGTMVVAEQGRNSIGQEVNIVVTSILQTPAGRMIFGRVEKAGLSGSSAKHPILPSDQGAAAASPK